MRIIYLIPFPFPGDAPQVFDSFDLNLSITWDPYSRSIHSTHEFEVLRNAFSSHELACPDVYGSTG